MPYIKGLATVFLQSYRDLTVQIQETAAPPVGLPSLASTYYISNINSQNIKIVTSSTLQARSAHHGGSQAAAPQSLGASLDPAT